MPGCCVRERLPGPTAGTLQFDYAIELISSYIHKFNNLINSRNMFANLKILFRDWREKRYWKFPDISIAYIKLDESESAIGSIKKNLGRLERIPKPETGYNYLDIVEVEGPIGKKIFMEDELDVYKVKRLFKKSNRPTFVFKIILPDSKDSFELSRIFNLAGFKAQIPWSSTQNNTAWRHCLCTATDLNQVKSLLSEFCSGDNRRKVKDILPWDHYLKKHNSN